MLNIFNLKIVIYKMHHEKRPYFWIKTRFFMPGLDEIFADNLTVRYRNKELQDGQNNHHFRGYF